MKIEEPVIRSLLDNDLYTLTVSQVAFEKFLNADVEYLFINRGKTPFPNGFADELRHQTELMGNLRLTYSELSWLKTLPYFHEEYLSWLSNYQFNPSELFVAQTDGNLVIKPKGKWMRSIMWEVPVLALVSELYYRLTGATKDNCWRDRIRNKSYNLSNNKCLWIDFGTRRRFSFEVQNEVVNTMKNFPGFLGTSNMFLAYKHCVSPNGTMSHQGPMAMMAKYGVLNANREWMKYWKECYGNSLSIYLVDTFSTDVFLKDFRVKEATEWSGLRQDSGDPHIWMDKVLKWYAMLGISTREKKFIFSDNLTDETYKELSIKYRKYATIIGGIGTNFSNDVGCKPLNIVVKLVGADFGFGMVDVVKLSDNPSKATGNADKIKEAKKSLNIL